MLAIFQEYLDRGAREVGMRAVKRKRPLRREISEPNPDIDLESIAKCAKYVGSAEHKDISTPAGLPRPRADASICDQAISKNFSKLTKWLRAAVRLGHVGGPWENGYPRYVWHKEDEIVFEARLINRESGEYKGWPLQSDEWPDFLR